MTGLYHYAIVGAGRQGIAAAYDMAKWGNAASILLADVNYDLATRAAERINSLLGREVATATPTIRNTRDTERDG